MRRIAITALGTVGLLGATLLPAQQASAPSGGSDHVAAIKQSLQESTAALHTYRWVETTAISIKGEEKSRTQASCYYGAEGSLQKTPIGEQHEAKKQRGLRGRVAEKKKEELTGSMKEAVALVMQYIPPDPGRIQAAKDAGRLSVVPPDAQGRMRITIKDYLKAGDSMSLDVNAAANRLTGVGVATFTDSAKDAVHLDVEFGAFPDGTVYPATTKLDVAAENLAVAITNSGYEKLGS